MDLTGIDREINAPQDFLAVNTGVKIFDFEHY
jgi:hypothetical protein